MDQKEQIINQISQIRIAIDNLENKNFNMYFFTLDTKGNPTAGIANIYEHVKILTELGFNAHILHEKNDYKIKGDDSGSGVCDWLGDEYGELSHKSIEGQNLNINPFDFIIIPEIFANVMDQVKTFPCKKIVFSQNYEYLLELLPIGKRWNVDYGFNDVITTTEKQAQQIKALFPSINTHVVPVSIPDYFIPSDKPKLPVVTIHTRNQNDVAKIVKSFYLQYPIYKWVSFKELKNLPRRQFATELGQSCLAIWIDSEASFGTFPIEAMQCETPVIGKIPNTIPEWMETTDSEGNVLIKNNGIWTNSTTNIPELIATYLKVWFEDSIPIDLINGIIESQNQYTPERQVNELTNVYNTLINNRIAEFEGLIQALENQLLQTTPNNQ